MYLGILGRALSCKGRGLVSIGPVPHGRGILYSLVRWVESNRVGGV